MSIHGDADENAHIIAYINSLSSGTRKTKNVPYGVMIVTKMKVITAASFIITCEVYYFLLKYLKKNGISFISNSVNIYLLFRDQTNSHYELI